MLKKVLHLGSQCIRCGRRRRSGSFWRAWAPATLGFLKEADSAAADSPIECVPVPFGCAGTPPVSTRGFLCTFRLFHDSAPESAPNYHVPFQDEARRVYLAVGIQHRQDALIPLRNTKGFRTLLLA